ncbi:hypothetical protein [Amycolatopsis taiwanensis]|uniref:hypothetical protein n=1 Tax=Amycolatopsis taiwanensis TaxID=342230 RepID=UPI0004891716|nr:hypothetical protein [Amycolatopsis taiwanensis]
MPFEDAGWGGMVQETGTAEGTWEDTRKSPELEGTFPYLTTWGVSSDADIFCWDATAEDPAGWPVLVFDRGDSMFSRYDCGMVEFLTRILRGDFPGSPLKGEVSSGVKGRRPGRRSNGPSRAGTARSSANRSNVSCHATWRACATASPPSGSECGHTVTGTE